MAKKSSLLITKLLLIVFVGVMVGCHGSSTSPNTAGTMTQQQIETRVTASTEIPSNILSAITGLLSAPSDTGSVPTLPAPPSSSSTRIGKAQKVDGTSGPGDWAGPDSQGWYTWTYEGGYGNSYRYTEKVRYQDKTLEYKFSITYSGTDGSYSYEIDFKCARATNGLLTGYYDIQVQMNSNQSGTNTGDHFRLEFTNCDPNTGAGVFDWYNGGDINSLNPYSHFLHMNAVDAGQGQLHVYVTTYGDYGGTWDYYCVYQPLGIENIEEVFGN